MPKRDFFIILALVLLLRIPFLTEAVQGDDSLFLPCASHALVDPLHPNHIHYIFTFLGKDIDFRGFSHPLINQWTLALLLAIFGSVQEVPFHAAYIAYSLLAAIAMYSLARRFQPDRALWATLLFLAVPAFVVNGGSLESDVPHVSLFLAGAAGFVSAVDRRSIPRASAAAFFLACAALTATQAQFAAPILAVYLWLNARSWKPGWVAVAAPFTALAGWEIFEYTTSGALPFAVTAGYVQQQGWDGLAIKLRGALGLFIQLWFLVFPPLLAAGLWALRRDRSRDSLFLLAWIAIYFCGAAALFFSGSARYLLPVAAPVAILATHVRRSSWIAVGFAIQMAISLGLAIANYQQWDAYRDFAHTIQTQAGGRRIWVNSEWALRHYLEEAGAFVPLGHQPIPPGDIVVWSELARPVEVAHPGAVVASMAQRDVRPAMPFRLIALESQSGYSSVDRGFLPFGIGDGLVDRIHADVYKEVKPTLSDLPMNAPEADAQIVSGLFGLEEGKQRWTAAAATVLLVSPHEAGPLHAQFYIPDNAPARRVTLKLDGETVFTQTLPGPGMHRIVSPPLTANKPVGTVALEVDRTFSAPGDSRELGVVLLDIGWGK